MPKVYTYDEVTKEFLYESKARIDPLESELTETLVWLLPANSTFTALPLAYDRPGFVWCFKDGEWLQEEDNRGMIFRTSDGEQSLITKLGEEIPERYTKLVPPYVCSKWDGEKWIEDEEVKKKEERENLIATEMSRLLKEQAVNNLKEQGVIK